LSAPDTLYGQLKVMNVDFMCASVDHISCTSQAIILMVCKFVRLIETLKKKKLCLNQNQLYWPSLSIQGFCYRCSANQ